jgi:hypothetical protein
MTAEGERESEEGTVRGWAHADEASLPAGSRFEGGIVQETMLDDAFITNGIKKRVKRGRKNKARYN